LNRSAAAAVSWDRWFPSLDSHVRFRITMVPTVGHPSAAAATTRRWISPRQYPLSWRRVSPPKSVRFKARHSYHCAYFYAHKNIRSDTYSPTHVCMHYYTQNCTSIMT